MKSTDNKKSKASLTLLFLKKFIGISVRSSSVKMQIFRLWFFYFASYIFGVLSATFYEKLFYGLEGFVNDEIHLAALIYALAGIAIQTIISYIIRSSDDVCKTKQHAGSRRPLYARCLGVGCDSVMVVEYYAVSISACRDGYDTRHDVRSCHVCRHRLILHDIGLIEEG